MLPADLTWKGIRRLRRWPGRYEIDEINEINEINKSTRSTRAASVRSDATSVAEYLDELPDDRRGDLEVVRESMLAAVPSGVVETLNWGMVSYEIPLERYPDTYNGQPLLFAALANQKRHMAVYLHCIYADPTIRQDFENEYAASGKPMDIGKSCVRFTRLERLPLDAIERAVRRMSIEEYIAAYEASRRRS